MSDSIETKGKTVDLAVSEALLQLGLRRDEVEIKVLEEPRAGLMGFLGARQAKVLVSKRRPTRGGRSGGRDHRRDDDHRAHDLTASGASGRGRGRSGGRDDNRGGRSEGASQPPRGDNRDNRGGRGGRDEARGPRDDNRGGRGGRDEVRAAAPREEAPRTRPAGEESNGAPREDRADGQRSRRRRGGRGRGGRGRGGQGQPRDEQMNAAGSVSFGGPDEFEVPAVTEQQPRPEVERSERSDRGDRNDRNDRGDRGGRGGRGGRDRGDRPARDQVEARGAGDEFVVADQPQAEAMPRERAREERSRRDLHVPVTPVSADDGASAGEAMAPPAIEPTVIETAVIVNTTPKAKQRAWGGLGARREKAPVAQPLARVEEVSPATAGSVFKPSAKALRTAAARAAAAAPTDTPSRVGEIDSPRSGSFGSGGYGGNSGGTTSGARHSGDEVIAANIAATDYAKPAAQTDEAGQPALLADLATGMLARAGFPCECETIPGEYHAVKVSADEDSAGMLIGRGGSTAEAIEHLVERMASNASGDRVRMNLDINEYRVHREDQLREHTEEAVAEVRATGEPYHMEPMDARERRIVHMTTADLPDITTYTVVGSGGKHVVIVKDDGTQRDEDGGGED